MTGHARQPAALVAALVLAAVGYVMAAGWLARCARPWPRGRTARWLLGLLVAGAALAVPAEWGLGWHMVGHTLLGMLAPLLLVTAAPVTLALRALPVARARHLTRLLRSRVLRVLAAPGPAAVLSIGGLWLLYRTGLHEASMREPLLLLAVQTHVLLSGCLLVAVLVGRDPLPHRARLGVRAAVLVGAVAAHNVLATSIVAEPPAGVGPAEALDAAQVMYYLGAPVEIALFVLLGAEWAARDRRLRGAGPGPGARPAGRAGNPCRPTSAGRATAGPGAGPAPG